MGNLQTAVRVVPRRQLAAQLCQKGWTHEMIAAELGCSLFTVNRYLKAYLATDSRFPVGINASQAEVMRAEQREHLEGAQQKVLAELDGWSKHKTSSYSVEERGIVADKICKLSDSLVRSSERISAMYGLDAPRPTPGSTTTTVTNNTVFLTGMLEELKAKRVAIQLEDSNAEPGH
jgi:predicted transcriptional regulator